MKSLVNVFNMISAVFLLCFLHLPGNMGECSKKTLRNSATTHNFMISTVHWFHFPPFTQVFLKPLVSTKRLLSSVREVVSWCPVRSTVRTTSPITSAFSGTNRTSTELFTTWDIWIWTSHIQRITWKTGSALAEMAVNTQTWASLMLNRQTAVCISVLPVNTVLHSPLESMQKPPQHLQPASLQTKSLKILSTPKHNVTPLRSRCTPTVTSILLLNYVKLRDLMFSKCSA